MSEGKHERDEAGEAPPAKKAAARRPDMVVYVVGDGPVCRWALFDLTDKQRAVLRDADEVAPCEKECEWARVILGDIEPAEASHDYMGEDVIPAENITKEWSGKMHPDGPHAPTEHVLIYMCE
jgi:hypothetical protein